jgi:hypothetical protein
MAKRDDGATRTNGGKTKTNTSGAMTTSAIEQLAGGAAKASTKKPAADAAARGGNRGRSGGVVDAPGKKHRKPMPTDPGTNIVDSQAEKMRTARTMVKTNRRRGRG